MTIQNSRNGRLAVIRRRMKKHWQLYLIVALPMVFILLFSYGPMYGIQIAFKDFNPIDGIWNSRWVGLEHFQDFIGSHQFVRLLTNTLGITLYTLIAGFPIPIILAISLNECGNAVFKKTVQMVTYAPHFISVVVMAGIVLMFLSPHTGVVNQFLQLFGLERIDFMAKPQYFKSIYVWSGIWQNMGYNSIIYLSALSGVDPSLHEAAMVDGTSRLKRIWHVDIPGILPTIIILLIMNTGNIMSLGYEKILLMQNSANMVASDVISTYVYRVGLQDAQYSLSAAVGLFNAVINCAVLVIVNAIARRVSEISLW